MAVYVKAHARKGKRVASHVRKKSMSRFQRAQAVITKLKEKIWATNGGVRYENTLHRRYNRVLKIADSAKRKIRERRHYGYQVRGF